MHKAALILSLLPVAFASGGIPAAQAGQEAPAHTQQATPYPGGRWEPGPPVFGAIEASTWVQMDDGVRLRATIGYPASPETGARAPGRFPVIVQHSPYTDDPVGFFVERGYLFVNVRPRGTGESGGSVNFNGMRDRLDGIRIIDWAARELDGSNGIIGLYGCSYPGQLALADAAAVGPNSPVKAVAALCAAGDYSHEIELAGGIATPGVAVLPNIGEAVGGNPATLAYFTALRDEILTGGDAAYHRSYWQERLLTDASAARVVANGIPVLLWAGWADVVEKAELEMYANFQNAIAGRPVRAPMTTDQQPSPRYQILLGEWGHGEGLDNGVVLQWFDTWLNNANTGLQHVDTPMHLYEQGSERWVNLPRYPMVNAYTTLHLSKGSTLTVTAPATPVDHTIPWAQPERGAILSFTTPPLPDGALLAGPIDLAVRASSSNRNLELIGSLHDIAPDGTATGISTGAVLGSQRALDPEKSWQDAQGTLIYPYLRQADDDYLMPGQVYRFDIGLFPRLWAVAPGHSLRLTLTTQMSEEFCSKAYFGSEPCLLTTPQQQTLPGGIYRIAGGHISLPLAPRDCLATARSGNTPTSAGVSLPLDWGRGYPAVTSERSSNPPPAVKPACAELDAPTPWNPWNRSQSAGIQRRP